MSRGTKKIKNIDSEENYIIEKLCKEEKTNLKDEEIYKKTKKMLDLIKLECRKYKKINDNNFINIYTGEGLTRHEITFEILKKCYSKRVVNMRDENESNNFYLLVEICISLVNSDEDEV